MENMRIWDRLKSTPKNAQKTIKGGRLNGFTEINPMWRIKMLTELFGPCGIGWKLDILDKWIECGANGEQSAFALVALRFKENGEWSEPVIGLGGSSFVAKERNGLYTSDECFKMAFTDALGSCCKLLGMSEDIFFEQGYGKYTAPKQPAPQAKNPPKETSAEAPPPSPPAPLCEQCGNEIKDVLFRSGAKRSAAEIINYSSNTFGSKLCYSCTKARIDEANRADAENRNGG